MNPRERLTTPVAGAAPWQQLTPDQKLFRQNQDGRLSADPAIGAHAYANTMTLHPDGTMDMASVDPDGDAWVDLGGKGGVDVAAGKP